MKKINNTYKGIFKPKNPEKYHGNAENIIYRSSWELRVMNYLDGNQNVLAWASEELAIPYINPIDKKQHRYFPDFIVKLKQKDNTIKTLILEVKPLSQTKEPKSKRKTKTFLQEIVTYQINSAKWRAADIFCQKNGWEFKLITEEDLGLT